MQEHDIVFQLDHFDKRVEKVEDGYSEMAHTLRDFQKDFHILAESFTEAKEILRSMNETSKDLELHKLRFQQNREEQIATTKRIHIRIDEVRKVHDKEIDLVKSNQSRVMWIVITAVIMAALAQVIKG